MKIRNFGFTLTEIMVVVFVISLLLSMVGLEVIRLRRIANEMNAQANLKSIATSFEVYAASHDSVYAPTDEDDLQFLVEAKYANIDFISQGPTGNFRFLAGSISPQGYDIRAIAVNPLLAEHNYQIVTGAKLLRSDSSASGDTNFKDF
jgi:prepilin-type N-terminal cleavage/methylation domain-containing protein